MQNFKHAVGHFMGDTVGASLKEGKKVMSFCSGFEGGKKREKVGNDYR